MYSYTWDGIGLLITTPCGECYLQGDEANELYDKLEELENDRQVSAMLEDYEHVCE